MHTLVSLIADGALIPVVLIGVYALIYKIPGNRRYEAYCRILMAGLTAFLVAKLMATMYQMYFPAEMRPFQLQGIAPGAAYLPNPGFPSDHALFATAIMLAVWFETRQKLWTGILVALVVLIGIGRVLALVHTPLDVAGGILAACIGGIWYLTAPQRQKSQPSHKSK